MTIVISSDIAQIKTSERNKVNVTVPSYLKPEEKKIFSIAKAVFVDPTINGDVLVREAGSTILDRIISGNGHLCFCCGTHLRVTGRLLCQPCDRQAKKEIKEGGKQFEPYRVLEKGLGSAFASV